MTQRSLAASCSVISSVHTWNFVKVPGPNEVVSATSVASRPRAIKTRPMRGALCRASSAYHLPPT